MVLFFISGLFEVVNEYFIGNSIRKAKNFIRFTLNINFLEARSLTTLVKLPALIYYCTAHELTLND